MAKRATDEGDSGILRGEDEDGTHDVRRSDGDTVAVADDDRAESIDDDADDGADDDSSDTTDDEGSSQENSLASEGGAADKAASSADSASEQAAWTAQAWAQANGFEGQSDEEIFRNIGQAAVRWQQHAYQTQSKLDDLQRQFDALNKQPAKEQAEEEFKWDKALPEYNPEWENAKNPDGQWIDASIPIKKAAYNRAFLERGGELLTAPHKFLEPVFNHYQQKFLSEAEKRMEERMEAMQRRIETDDYLRQYGHLLFEDGDPSRPSQVGQMFRQYVDYGKENGVPPGKMLREFAENGVERQRLANEVQQLQKQLAQLTGQPVKQNGKAKSNGQPRDKSGQFTQKTKAERAEEKRQQLLDQNSRKPSRNGTEGRGDTEQNEDLDIYARLKNQLRMARAG